MSKRLQVLIEAKEYKSFQRLARETGLSLGEWVRQALRRLAMEKTSANPQEKLAALRRYADLKAPTGDIEQILAEIEQGYISS
ncbi:MAG TPA: antitoxin [Deltaproteobacteria bacterium]|nr:antitoxin [Deltaproteobacteria bacterium]